MRDILWKASIAAAVLCSGCNLEQRVPVEMATMNQSRPIGSESSLQADVRLDIGSLEISGQSASRLYSATLEYDKSSYLPEINYEPGTEGRLTFKLESNHLGGIRTERQNNRLILSLTDALPVSLQVNTGVGDARLALSRLRLSRLDLEAGVGGARLSAYDPNPTVCDQIRLRNGVGSLDAVGLGNLNFRRFEFEGGVGGANLDFSGLWKQDAEVRVQVGVGGVDVKMPRDVGVRVSAEKHFLSGLRLDGFHRESGADYYSENYNEKKIHVSVVVTTGIGGFRITWI
ncbi:MAG: toast rack family protein [Acidobacteriia bacterium]|nr:toast rack family protein [Terriglobia bacterium]